MDKKVGIDSNALTYLIQATEPEYNPSNDEIVNAEEKIAMVRLFFYIENPFFVPPTVKEEYQKINNPGWRIEHDDICSHMLLDPKWELDESVVKIKEDFFYPFHKKKNDCRILAECDVGDKRWGPLDILVSADGDFVNRLAIKTKYVCLMKPSEYWESLKIPTGTKPIRSPRYDNPLFREIWHIW
jgi:hypothetical protein